MPLLLTAVFDPGDLDPGKTYAYAKVISFFCDLESEHIVINYRYGNVVGGVWERGDKSPTPAALVEGANYATMVAELATLDDGYGIYTGAKRVLYDYLLDEGILSGTIV